jgi:hypothetical protein
MIGVVAKAEEQDVVREFFELFKTPWEFRRDGGRYDVLIRTDGAIDHHPAKLVIVYGSQLGPCDRDVDRRAASPRHGTMLSWNGRRIPLYGGCLIFPSDGTPPNLVVEETGRPVVSVTRANGTTILRVGYDLFREIRFLLTTGQPSVHAGIPTLERHIAFLRHSIVSAGIPVLEIPPIPEGYRFIVCLTHDVDHPAIRAHRFDHTMFGFLYRAVVRSLIDLCRGRTSPTTLWRNWRAALMLPFVHLGVAKDFWSQFDRYLEIEKGLGSTFFVIPVKRDPGRTVDGRAPMIRASAYGVADITHLLRPLRAAGCEVALHGIDAWLDRSRGSEERERVSRVTGVSASGVRMHWLFFDERAPERLDEAGFTYDSTFGYNDAVGLRAGTMQAFQPTGARRLLELPLTIMDTALFYPSHLNLTPKAAKQVVWRLVDEAERYGGALIINWHDRSLAPERLWGEFYVQLIDELKRREAWFPTASQAASWFRQRRSAVFGSVHWEGCSARIRASADRRQDLPGLTIRVHTPSPPDDDRPVQWQRSERFTDVTFGDAPDRCVTAGAYELTSTW